jgi:DNA-binding transcriptional regulator YdaS (Cro superfamily)
MHPLRGYLAAQHLTVDEFAVRMKRLCRGRATTAGYLHQIMGGHRHPSRALAKAIERASFGDVSAAALLTFERELRAS